MAQHTFESSLCAGHGYHHFIPNSFSPEHLPEIASNGETGA